jgi:hypothetical protein
MTDRPGVAIMAAGAGCTALGVAGLLMLVAGAPAMAYALLPFVFASVFGAGLMVDHVFDVRMYRRQRLVAVRKLEAEVRLFDAEVDAKVDELLRPAALMIHNEPPKLSPHGEAWRAYWVAQLIYASEHGGLAWQQMREIYPQIEDWRDNLVLPLVRKGWVHPIQQGVPTVPAEGMTLGKIILAMMDGDLPPLPSWHPPESASERKQPAA